MRNFHLRASACAAAVLYACFSSVPVSIAASSTWIDPADPTGTGTDPNASANLNGTFNTPSHWNAGIPTSTDNALFNAPGYPSTPYTVTFTQNTNVNQFAISNPVTFNLGGFNNFALQSSYSSNNAALFLANQSSLSVTNGYLTAENIQVGSNSGSSANASLTVDGTTGTANLYTGIGGLVVNYQKITLKNAGDFILANNTLVNQAPDLAAGGTNTAQITLSGAAGLYIGNNCTLSGGTLHLNDGFIAPTGSSLTYNSLLFDGPLNLGLANVTTTITSSLHDPNNGNAVIPATVTGIVNATSGALHLTGATLRLTPDNGSTWHTFYTSGSATTTVQNSFVTAADLSFDGAASPGSSTTIGASLLTSHGNIFVANAGTASLTLQTGAQIDNAVGYIAPQAGSRGTVLLDNATWNNSSFLEIGDAGNATLTLQNNANLTNTSVNLSFYSTGISNVTLNHSAWNCSSFMTVGEAGTAALSLANISALSVGSTLYLGNAAGSSGTLLVSGGSVLTVSGQFAVGVNGTANATISSTAVVSANATSIGPGGTLTFSGGTLVSPSVTNNGLLRGNGTITGNFTNNANVSVSAPDVLNLSGTYTQSANASLSGNGTLIAQAFFGTFATLSGTAQVRANGTSAGTSRLTTLILAGAPGNWTGALDLTNNNLIVEPAASRSTVFTTLQNQVAYGRTHTAGIYSSTLAPNLSLAVLDNAVLNKSTFGGLSVGTNSILVGAELLGDANADGTVNTADLNTVLNNFGALTPNWTSGNFDNAPGIDLTDLADVLNNFGLTTPGSGARSANAAPEPASLLLVLPVFLVAKRRPPKAGIYRDTL